MAGVVAFAAYTGMRRSDILKLSGNNFCEISGRPHLVYTQKKTGALVTMPIPAALMGNVLIQRGMAGLRPVDNHMSESSFKHHYRVFLKAVGVDKPFHGLRKLCAVMMAEAGCSMPEIMSVTGHRSTATAAHYMRSASKRTLSTNAIERLDKHEVQDRLLKGQQQSVGVADHSPEREADGPLT
jgi:integrase